jgi:transglutaminase-like putative cysteine protease
MANFFRRTTTVEHLSEPNQQNIAHKALRHLLLLRLMVGCFLVCVISAPVFAADEAPDWLKQASLAKSPVYGKDVPAVVLLSERTVTVGDDGKVTTFERYAVRILSIEGRGEARGSATYLTDTGKVKDMRAWLVRPSEEVKKYGKEQTLDMAMALNDVFNEARRKVINASDEAEVGAVFGYEYTSEDRSVFTQFDWDFQDRLPALASRFTMSLPAGWRAESVMFNHPKIEPTINGSTYSWELRGLSHIEEEPASPPVSNLIPRLAVSFFPAAGAKAGIGKSFDKWSDVSRWLFEMSDSQAVANEAMNAKVRDLTANAKTEFEKIQAIGRFAQSVNYVSIQTGIGRGGGYRPHSAVDVFAKSYGDCKDKANLMRAMLKVAGINSYLVSIYSGDPTYVREEWPSPQQFNHCIIAVKVSDETNAPTVITHPTLGRLLVFDPTDDNTPVGDLPDHEQNSLALIIAAEAGTLIRMPSTPPEANKVERQIDAVLGADGSLSAKIVERTAGQSAVDERRAFRSLSKPDYLKFIERWITRGVSGSNVAKVEPADNSVEGKFTLNVEFSAGRYAQLMQGRLLVFKPTIVARRDSFFLTDGARKHPVMLDSHAYTETVRIKLPEGFVVDEIPSATKMDTSFGSYSTSYEVKDGILNFSRNLVVRNATIPVADYEKVKRFFSLIYAAEQEPIVLAKK